MSFIVNKMTKQFNPQSISYMKALIDVLENYDNYIYDHPSCNEIKSINNSPIFEKTFYEFRIKNPTLEHIETMDEERNKIIRNYTDKETVLFDEGDDNSTGNFSSLSKVWDSIKNPDGTINANYGLMVYHTKDIGNFKYNKEDGLSNGWDWAKQRLRAKIHTNQAIIHFCRPSHLWKGNKDIPCTLTIQFLCRNNKLNLISNMRSNDLVYGTPYNISYFIKLMYRMRDELKDLYPELEIGDLIHRASSIHIYEKHLDKAKSMVKGFNNMI